MLEKFLDEKPLYYDEIDYGRMPRVYNRIKDKLTFPKIVHLVGTNGKGTTGRFLATALYNLGYKVGHYTSPHIVNFNERIWIDGSNITDNSLNLAHERLQNILTKEESNALSYFEYTTFIAMIIFEKLDYIVLEAGLGGEHDATAVFDKIVTLVTPIDLDHEAFLGSTISAIATTKLNAVRNSAILSEQKHEEVYTVSKELSQKKDIKFYKIEDFLDDEDYLKIEKITKSLELVEYLKSNLKLSISTLKFLNINYDVKDFNNSKLFGRLTSFKDNILLDVGHNVLAANSISLALKDRKYILVYNTYKDKNYREILSVLKPIVKHIEIINIDESRIEDTEVLKQAIKELDIECRYFLEIDSKDNYLIFGSFKVVEEFLRNYHE